MIFNRSFDLFENMKLHNFVFMCVCVSKDEIRGLEHAEQALQNCDASSYTWI